MKTASDPGGKANFDIDFDRMVATCPGGVATTDWRLAKKDGEPTQAFTWPKGSESECTCSDRCIAAVNNLKLLARTLAEAPAGQRAA